MAKKKLYYETEEFKQLQKKWYGKLDLDVVKDNPDHITIHSESSELVVEPQVFKTDKSQYYGGLDYAEFCEQLLREFKFRKDVHRIIFEKHAGGVSDRDIADLLMDKYEFEITQQAINSLINRVKSQYLAGTHSK